jgi:serine/threonine-protein kinase ULK2
MTSNFTRKKIEGYSYGLGDAIGKGYSSQVYKGRHDDSQQPVAVKVIDLRLLKNDINRVLLESEVQVLKELRGLPHILTLHEVYTTKNNTYIVTELCQGDLSARLKGGLPPAKACAFMRQIITGYLGFARKQIIHRDLKPANILVTEGEQLKVADFGFAIKAADAHKYSKYNVGSPLYMAPESLKRNEYSLKTDVWALGVIFYELLTGETPWKARHEKELVKKIEMERADEIIAKLTAPPQVKEFLKKALRVEKSERMDVEEVAAFDLEAVAVPRINVLTERKTNVRGEQRLLSIFSPKVEKSVENRLGFGENRVSTKDLSERKLNTLRSESANKGIPGRQLQAHKYNPSVTLELFRKEDSSAKENPEFMAPQPRDKEDGKKPDRKLTSKILISEIHFCRFLYKLLGRITESKKGGLLGEAGQVAEQVTYDYMGIIKHKIENLLGFKNKNYIGVGGYEEYKQTADYQKLMKIAKEYKERYQTEMKPYWNSCKCCFATDSTLALVSTLRELLRNRETTEQFTATYEQEIVILDYLMTAKQLIDIFQNGENYERFARKSRIEEIVEGRTAEISRELYVKIVNRSKEVTELKQRPTHKPDQDRTALVSA